MTDSWGSWKHHNRPPKHPGPQYSSPPSHPSVPWHSSIHSWEKRFCTSVCAVPWGKICAAKASLCAYKNIAEWDDSAALEAFNNAKSRYYAYINHVPYNIPLPDSNLYIEKVDHNSSIDPKLVEDLEKVEPPPLPNDSNNNNGSCGWDLSNNANKNNEEEGNISENHSNANWDKFIEKPTTTASSAWNRNAGWGESDDNKLWNNGRDNSWGHEYLGDNKSWNNEQNYLWGRNENNLDRNSRKRNGGYFDPTYSNSGQNNNYQGYYNNDNRNMMGYPYDKSKSRRICGPNNHQRPMESGGGIRYRRNY